MWPMHPETLLVSAARPAKEVDAPVNEPVHLTSTFVGWEPGGSADRRVYGRMSNPSWDGPEELLAALEGVPDPQATPGLLFSSGMAAIAAALHLVPLGARVIVPQHQRIALLPFDPRPPPYDLRRERIIAVAALHRR